MAVFTRNLKGMGRSITVRAPTLDEISTFIRSKVPQDGMRRLAEVCCVSPSLADLTKEKPAMVASLASTILQVFGNGEAVRVFEPDDLGAAEAEAYVKATEKGFTGLVCVSVHPQTEPEPLVFIFRLPKDLETQDYMRDLESMKVKEALIRKLCIHGPLAIVVERYPLLIASFCHFLMERSGSNEEFELDFA